MILFNALANIAETGYGGFSKNLILELLSMGFDVRTSLRENERADVQIFSGQLFKEYLEHPKTHRLQADKLVFFTMWEASILPREFIEAANEKADLIIVPSQWNADIFKANGVETPIEVVPLGFVERDFPPLKRGSSDGSKPFTFLWQGFIHTRDRKGGNLVEQAFIDLVNTGELPRGEVQLIMKSQPYLIPALGQNHKGFNHTQENGMIRVYQSSLPQVELLGLLQESDVSFYPTSGEGFGLIALEHLATGLPLFAPYATGMTEFLPNPKGLTEEENVFFPLETKLMDALVEVPGAEDNPGQIERPFYDDVREKMKWAFDNRDKLPDVGARGAAWAHGGYTYRESALCLIDKLRKRFGYNTNAINVESYVETSTPIPDFTSPHTTDAGGAAI